MSNAPQQRPDLLLTSRLSLTLSLSCSGGSARRGSRFNSMLRHDEQLVDTGAAAPIGSVDVPALEQKKTFVRTNPAYGYTSAAGAAASVGQGRLKIDSIRQLDFPSLLQPLVGAAEVSPAQQDRQQQQQQQQQRKDLVYLDHAGATLFGASQLREAMEPLLAGAVHGNPHSQVQTSQGYHTYICGCWKRAHMRVFGGRHVDAFADLSRVNYRR